MAALERHRESALAAFFTALLTVAGAYLGVRYGGLVGLYVANLVVTALTVIGLHAYLARVSQASSRRHARRRGLR